MKSDRNYRDDTGTEAIVFNYGTVTEIDDDVRNRIENRWSRSKRDGVAISKVRRLTRRNPAQLV